ncbi:hypothetical protein IAU59_001861 [Kwoniella sp. CBS 9459]
MSSLRKPFNLSLAFAILSTFVDGRKDDESGGGGIDWIAPTSESLAGSGEPLTAIWRSDGQVYSPSFALCTSGETDGDCGKESWPQVTDNGDGTYSATLTMPVIAQGMNGLYLSMKGDDGSMNGSPRFAIDGGTGTNAYLASAPIPSSAPTDLLTADELITAAMTASSSWVPSYALSPSSTKTKVTVTAKTTAGTPITSAMPLTASAVVPYSSATSAYNQVQAQAQAQAPLQATAPVPPPIAAADATANSYQTEAAHHAASKPSATAIALPLALCGLILVSALIFCARSRVFRKPGLGKDVEKWQEIVKEKAAASAAASASTLVASGSQGVEVRQRTDNNPYKGYMDPEVPAFGYRGREASNDGYKVSRERESSRQCASRSDQSERFTAIPEVHYDRRRDRGSGDGDDRDRARTRGQERPRSGHSHRHHSHSSSRREGPFDDRYSSSLNPRDYYATSRRSSSGIGGVYDSYNALERQGGCDCTHSRSHSHSHSNSHTSSRQPIHVSSHATRSSRSSSTRETVVRRPSPVQNDSFGPLSNPHDAVQSRSNGRRPLPEPIIRSSTLTSRGSSIDPFGDMAHQKTLPHVTGGLRDEQHPVRIRHGSHHANGEYRRRGGHETPTEAGWEMDLPLAGEGAYRTGDEGMGELYESLRRAIAARG